MTQMQTEFPEYAKVQAMGKSFEGRDINLLEISAPSTPEEKKPAIFMTGATHPRELISTSINMYKALKLLQQGVVDKDPATAKLLKDNKYYFVPALNVDGLALIE
jgi:carboxypeptidase T